MCSCEGRGGGGRRFRSLASLVTHLESTHHADILCGAFQNHDEDPEFECCGKEFMTAGAFTRHCNDTHGTDINQAHSGLWYCNSDCGKQGIPFSGWDELKEHLEDTHGTNFESHW